ncbi:zinc finger protein 142-like [Argopecten irradians]|uniref:zinc finger protein 142-like n=1 Tax=Argopecten irradians TaxID=31199 RepID=UPI003721ABC9
MGKKNSMLTLLKCDLCSVFSTKNAYIFKRHKIRCKRERYTEAHTPKQDKVKFKLSGASLFASASTSRLTKLEQPEPISPAEELVDDLPVEGEKDPDPDDPQSENFRKGHVYCRTYRCTDCTYWTNKSKTFLYHLIDAHNKSLTIFACNFCEYACKHRHKVQRHLKLVHHYNIDIDDVKIEYQSEMSAANYKNKSPKASAESPVKNIAPLKVKIALTTTASRQAARGKEVLPVGYENHIVELTSGGQKLFKCKYCLFNNADKYRVSKHVQCIHINAKTYKCNICPFTTVKKKDYYAHKSSHSGKTAYKCHECDYTSDFKPNLDRHRLNHTNKYSIKCKFCTYSCDHEGTVKRHMANNHTNSAENVSLIFPDADTSVESVIDENPPQSLQTATDSPVSGKQKDQNTSLNISDTEILGEGIPKLQTLEGSFFCPICGLKYRRSSDLNRHMKLKHKVTVKQYLRDIDLYANTAAEVGPNQLELESYQPQEEADGDIPLDLSVSSNKDLDDSMDNDSLKCCYCSYQAKWPSDLQRHMVVHTVEKRYKCPHCNKQYKYVGDLNVHLRRDHKKEPGSVKHVKVPTIPNRKSSPAIFKCPSCTFTSPWKSEVDRHSKLHKGDKPFCCKHCIYQTHWKGDIRRHMYKHHPGVMVDDVVLDDVITILADKLPGKDKEAGELLDDERIEKESDTSFDTENVFDGEDDDSGSESPPLKPSPSGLYRCNFCDFVTNAQSKLKYHESTHTNLKQYMCPVCGRRANWKWDIRKHIKKDHPISSLDVIKLSRKEAEATIQAYLDTMPVVRREHHLNVPTNTEVTDTGEEASKAGNSFVCSACDFNSNTRVAVSRHIRTAHSGLNVDIICLVEEDVDDEIQIKIPRMSSEIKTSTPVAVTDSAINNHPSFYNAEPDDKPYKCVECGKTGNIKADIRKHYHYRHPNQPIKILYTDESGTKMLPEEAPMPRNNKRKLSSSSDVSNMLDMERTPNKSMTNETEATPEKQTPDVTQNRVSAASLIKPFMCGDCGKRSSTKADIKKHYNYIHPGLEVKVVYQENPNSPYDRFKPANTTPTAPASSPAKSPSPGSAGRRPYNNYPGGLPIASADPKVFGYCKPFQCSDCGRRSNWKWDLNKHIRLKHPGSTTAHMIALTEAEARATHDEYMAMFNQTTHVSSAYKRAVMQEAEEAEKVQKIERDTTPETLADTIADTTTDTTTDETDKMDTNPQNIPSKGVYKQFKCSGCPYRSNWRSDIVRHTKRKHGGRSRLVVMDTEEAKVSLMEYNYNPRKKREGDDNTVSKHDNGLTNIWKCGKCSFKNRDRTVVINHLSMHNVKAYKCSLCNYSTNYRSSACRHIRVRHHSENLSLCRSAIKCVKQGKDGQVLEPISSTEKEDFDWKDAEPNNFYDMFKCKLCGFQSSWRSCVTRHLREKHKGGGSKGKVLRVRKYLKDDQKSKSAVRIADRRFKCDVCPYRTDKSNLLQFHMSCHKAQPDTQQVKCPYCPYFVVAQRLLRQHIKLHEENVYPETTSKKEAPVFSAPTTPVKNVTPVIQTTPKRHRCEKCPYTSNSKNDYLYHKQFHKPKENAEFKCHLCDYWVTHRRLLKQHMKVHEVYHPSPAAKSTNSSAQSSPCKSDFSESSSIYDMVQLANYKQKVIASKIMPSISQKPLMSPMKIACSVGNKPGYVFRNGVYKKLQKCKKCPYMTVRLRNLKLHEMMHNVRISRNPLLKCPHCDYYVGSKGLISHHLKVHQPGYMMDFSDTTISDLEAIENGGAEEDVDDKSDIVDIPYENKVDTLYEIARFKKYSCEKCPYASAKRSHYEHHVELHGSKQRCGCRYCDYSVPSQNLLAQHEKLHRTPNQNLMVAQSLSNLLQLPEVPADVALASALPPLDTKESFTVSVTHDHLELFENSADTDSEPKKLYRCDRCPYANVRRDHLLSHLKFHMIRSDLACPYCDYTASKQHLLTQHIKVHFSPLPELSNWLAQNGQMDRMKQSKEPDITEALHVAQLIQGEIKKEGNKRGLVTDHSRTGEKTGQAVSASKSNLSDIPSSSSDCQLSTTEPVAVKPAVEVLEKSIETEKAAPERLSKETPETSENNAVDVVKPVTDQPKSINSSLESDMDVSVKEEKADEHPSENKTIEKDTGSKMLTEPAMELSEVQAEQEETKEKLDGYICQYCDREFAASGHLVMHEMQHLIGNNFKDYLTESQVQIKTEEVEVMINGESEKVDKTVVDETKTDNTKTNEEVCPNKGANPVENGVEDGQVDEPKLDGQETVVSDAKENEQEIPMEIDQ